MKRKKFVKLIGGSCLAMAGIPVVLSGCSSVHYVHTSVRERTITLSKKEFVETKAGKQAARDLVLVRATSLAFPIAVYRKAENDYNALWMECTHQGCEVNAQANYLICPCHGSEFNAQGHVLEGPAESNLKTFNITTDYDNLYIHL